MKQMFFAATLILVTLALAVIFRFLPERNLLPPSQAGVTSAPPKAFRTPGEKSSGASIFQTANPARECLDYADRIRNDAPPGINLSPPPACELPVDVSEELARAQQSCANDKNQSQCHAVLTGFRAALTDWSTKNISAQEIHDPRILVDKLTHRFRSDPASAKDIADRLAELRPQSYFAVKAALLATLTVARTEDKPAWPQIENLLERARSIAPLPEEKTLTEIEAAMNSMKHRETQATVRFAEFLDRTHPSWGVGPYQLAWVAYRRGDLPNAISNVREALRREPRESRYRRTLAKLKFADPSVRADVFEANLDLSLDSEEDL